MTTNKMKWSREAPGHYVSGRWAVEGKGVRWKLSCDGARVAIGRSKGELQRAAEKDPGAPAPEEAATPAPRRAAVAAVGSVESVLASLRLEVENLTLAVRELNARLDRR